MSKTNLLGGVILSATLALAAMNPAAAADRRTTNTILGAGVGAAAGAVLSQGDTLATLGGAAAGGLLGHVLTEEPRKYRHSGRHKHPPRHAHHRGKPPHAYYTGNGKGKHHHKHHHKHRHHR